MYHVFVGNSELWKPTRVSLQVPLRVCVLFITDQIRILKFLFADPSLIPTIVSVTGSLVLPMTNCIAVPVVPCTTIYALTAHSSCSITHKLHQHAGHRQGPSLALLQHILKRFFLQQTHCLCCGCPTSLLLLSTACISGEAAFQPCYKATEIPSNALFTEG